MMTKLLLIVIVVVGAFYLYRQTESQVAAWTQAVEAADKQAAALVNAQADLARNAQAHPAFAQGYLQKHRDCGRQAIAIYQREEYLLTHKPGFQPLSADQTERLEATRRNIEQLSSGLTKGTAAMGAVPAAGSWMWDPKRRSSLDR